MILLDIVKEFMSVGCLAGVIILSRHISKGWQIFIGALLVIIGLLVK